jgi:hypothetical protein
MTLTKTINLLLRCSADCPYSGKLENRHKYIAAVELAKLFRDFAERGCTEEAMHLDVPHWDKAIKRLESHVIMTGPIFKIIK